MAPKEGIESTEGTGKTTPIQICCTQAVFSSGGQRESAGSFPTRKTSIFKSSRVQLSLGIVSPPDFVSRTNT